MCHVIEAGVLQGNKVEKILVTGKELPDNSCNLRLNVNGKTAPVSLAQFHQVLVGYPILVLGLQPLLISLRFKIQFYVLTRCVAMYRTRVYIVLFLNCNREG